MISSIPFIGVIISEIEKLNISISELFIPFLESHNKTGDVTDLQFTFQDYAGPSMQGILELHHDLLYLLFLIFGLVVWLFFITLTKFNYTDQIALSQPLLQVIKHMEQNLKYFGQQLQVLS
jgi:hypothetical protein